MTGFWLQPTQPSLTSIAHIRLRQVSWVSLKILSSRNEKEFCSHLMDRLRKQHDFAGLFRRGRRFTSSFFYATTLPNRTHHARMAFIVSKAVDKRSVVRNRLRRRAREWIRKQNLLASLPLDIALTIRKEAAVATRKEFYDDLSRLTEGIRRAYVNQ